MNNKRDPVETAPAAEFVPTHGGVYLVDAGKVTTLEGGPPAETAPVQAVAPINETKDGAA